MLHNLKFYIHTILVTSYTVGALIYMVFLFYDPGDDVFDQFLLLICFGSTTIFFSYSFYYKYCFDHFNQNFFFLFPIQKSKVILLDVLYQLRSFKNMIVLIINTAFLILLLFDSLKEVILLFVLMLVQYISIITILVLLKNLKYEHSKRAELVMGFSIYMNLITVFASTPFENLTVLSLYSPFHKSIYLLNYISLISFVVLTIVMFFIYQSAKKWRLK